MSPPILGTNRAAIAAVEALLAGLQAGEIDTVAFVALRADGQVVFEAPPGGKTDALRTIGALGLLQRQVEAALLAAARR
jgi:hypothetical protein